METNSKENTKSLEDETSDQEIGRHINRFQFLNSDDDVVDCSDNDNEEIDQGGDQSDVELANENQNISTSRTKSSKKRNQKKKSKQKNRNLNNSSVPDPSLSIQEHQSEDRSVDLNVTTSDRLSLLKLSHKNLNSETELKRMFGKCVLKEEKTREGLARMRIGMNLQRSRFVPSSDLEIIRSHGGNYPKMIIDNLLNEKVSRVGTIASSDQSDETYFRYVHDEEYQKFQSQFMVAVNHGVSELIVQNCQQNPTHVESLVKLADLMRLSENYKDASQCIERALVILERGFHPKFNPMTGNCRLTYRRPENRTLYITLFKHISCLNRRGLRRTPLEYAKFLLSLDPDTDPLFAISLIDYFAIRSEEFDYYIDFVSKWKHSSRLPSFNLSLALAYFMKSRNPRLNKTLSDECLKLADEKLQLSLLRYPNFIVHLLDAWSAEPEGNLKKCDYFNYTIFGSRYKTVPESIELLIGLYVQRTCPLWKAKHVMAWLEKNVEILVDKFANKQITDEQINIKYWSPFQGPVPRNILRHVILSELQVKLPPSVSGLTTLDIDPFPPDSILSYHVMNLSDNRQSSSSSGSSLGIAGLFLRSLLPSFSQVDDELVDLSELAPALARMVENSNPNPNQSQNTQQNNGDSNDGEQREHND